MRRNKGIGFFERSFDKLLVLVMLAAFLGVAAWQLTSGAGSVRVGDAQAPLDRAYEQLAQKADQLRVQLEEPIVDRRTPPPPAPLAPVIAEALRSPTRGSETLATPIGLPNAPSLGQDGGAIATGDAAGEQNPALGLPTLPAPTTPLATLTIGAMDPFEPALHADIAAAKVLPSQQPYDFRAVTIQAAFDAGALLDATRADPDGPEGPLERAPENWWRSRLAVVDIEVQRQRVDAADSPLDEPVLVPPPPGRPTLRDRISPGMAPEALDAVVARARQSAKPLLNPSFYSLIAGGPWRLPAVANEFDAKQSRVQQLVQQRRAIIDQIQELQRASWQPVGGGGGNRGGGQQRPSASDERDRAREREAAAAQARKQRLEQLQSQLAEVESRLADLGFSPEGAPLADPTAVALAAPAPTLTDPAPFAFWTFDPFARPGQRYTYRVRLLLANPLYGRDASLADEAKPFAQSPTIPTAWSEWTAPVSVDRESYLFITRANEGALGDEASATAELFRYFYGGWRRMTKRVSAGDRLEASAPVASLGASALPVFDVRLDDSGAPTVVGQSPLQSTLLFDQGGAFVSAIVPSPDVVRGRERDFDVIIRVAGQPQLALRSPKEEGADPLRRRLLEGADAAASMAIRVPGAPEGEGGKSSPEATSPSPPAPTTPR